MLQINWLCPNCKTVNETEHDEVELYCQFCIGCGKEFNIDTDGLTFCMPMENVKEV